MSHITCPKYVSRADSRRCRYYLEGGSCELPDEFMCVEWLKSNAPTTAPSRELHETLSPVNAPGTFSLSAPAPRPEKPVRHLAAVPAPVAPIAPAALPSRDDLDALEASGISVRLTVKGDDVWLVREKTGKARRELTFSAAKLLSDAVAALGATLEEIRFAEKD